MKARNIEKIANMPHSTAEDYRSHSNNNSNSIENRRQVTNNYNKLSSVMQMDLSFWQS
jgi:hypothetical protein